MQQRDIYLANLDPVIGSEQSGTRPVVIISGNTMNKQFANCIVCPVTSKIKNFAACVKLKPNSGNNLDSPSEIITFQLRTVSKKRLLRKIGSISNTELQEVFSGLTKVFKY